MRKNSLVAMSMTARISKQGRPPTLLEHCMIQAGITKGPQALMTLLIWMLARRRNGGAVPTWEELQAAGAWSRPAAFKNQALLRAVFGGDDGIIAVADSVEESAAEVLEAMETLTDLEVRNPAQAVGLLGALSSPVPL